MQLRTVDARRYVTPLREGGSLPAIVEGDDAGLYVLKFRGAGQGPKVLIAELLAGEIGRVLGLDVPELVLMTLDGELARTEADPEIQALIKASVGLNIASDYLPGAVTYDPLVQPPDAGLASRIVWFDAFITNVDRTAKNVNMLVWHRKLRLIDTWRPRSTCKDGTARWRGAARMHSNGSAICAATSGQQIRSRCADAAATHARYSRNRRGIPGRGSKAPWRGAAGGLPRYMNSASRRRAYSQRRPGVPTLRV